MKKNAPSPERGTARDKAIATDVLDHSARFLKTPLLNILRYHSARFVLALPWLSEASRAKYDMSVRKRNYAVLSELLSKYPRADGTTTTADGTRQLSAAVDLSADFRKTQAPKRRQVLLGTEHRKLMAARDAPPPRLAITLSFVTFNSARWLDGFLASLLAQSYPLGLISLRFADHGSTDDSIQKIEQFLAQNRHLFRDSHLVLRENDGFGGGHNANIRASGDAFVLVSNVDVEFGADTLSGLVAAAASDAEDVACWEARQCPYEHPKFYDPVTLETAWCSHACILIRRSAYEAVGGYEERIFMYGEDVELSYRFRGAGWRLRYLPHVPVRHFVDFDDPTLRPHQLTGSLSANVLLRYRYGGDAAGEEGERLLDLAESYESDPKRHRALVAAQEKIDENRMHYRSTKLPRTTGVFPFAGFDYEIGRTGHDTALDSLVPLAEKPLVSIITRTHGPNQGILREAIASVLNQSYRNIEHLIVEDRGNLAEGLVAEVAEAYKTNIRFLRSDRGGRSATANHGLAAAKGNLLLFLDNDDLLFADHVELLVRTLQSAPDAVAAYSLGWEIETFFSASGAYRDGGLRVIAESARPYSERLFKIGNFIPIQSILFRRTLYDQDGGIDEEIDYLEDWNLWTRYSRNGRFALVPKITSLYRMPGDPVFREDRRLMMIAAEAAVRQKTFGAPRKIALMSRSPLAGR